MTGRAAMSMLCLQHPATILLQVCSNIVYHQAPAVLMVHLASLNGHPRQFPRHESS
jgi:hypothetical protein